MCLLLNGQNPCYMAKVIQVADANGWIKLHRKVLDNPIVMKDTEHFAVWVYLLLKASHTEYPVIFGGQKMVLHPGQLITGRKKIASDIGISESKVFRILKTLKIEQQIEQQASNKNSLISIINWDEYQSGEQQTEQQVNNSRTASEQQVNTNKNIKNGEEDKEGKERIDYQSIADLFNSICVSYSSIRSLSEARKKAIKARLNTYSVKDFETLFKKAESSSFLKGNNDRNWTATFDWLIKDSNMAKVLDGNYDDRNGRGNSYGRNTKNSDEVQSKWGSIGIEL